MWIFDWLPWYVPVLIIAAAAVATIPIWLPIAKTIWAVLPNWARWVLSGFGLGTVLFWYASNAATRRERERQKERDAQAAARRQQSDAAFNSLTDSEKEKERKKWDRD